MTYTPEPWLASVDGKTITDHNADIIAETRKADDTWRIVIVVNSCAGIPDKALEDGVIRELIDVLKDALELVEMRHRNTIKRACDVLAKVEGEK